MLHHLDAYAYTNRLNHLPPQQKLIFALALLSIALISQPFTQTLIILWLFIWTVGYAQIPVSVYLRVFALTSLFLLLSLPALAIDVVSIDNFAAVQPNSLGGVFLHHWYIFLSLSGVTQAAIVLLRSLSCTACLLFILFTIPVVELLSLLRKCHIPEVLLELMLLMYRFIFLFLDVANQLYLAQQSRGGYHNRKRWMQSAALLVSQLIVRSLQRYKQYTLGLTARQFKGSFRVHSLRSYKYSPRYALEALIGCTALALLTLANK